MKVSNIAKAAAILFIAVIITSCNCRNHCADKDSPMLVSVDSLDDAWCNAWNSNNVPAIRDLFAENAVLIAGDWKVTGRDALTEQWIKTSVPAIANLQLQRYMQSANSTMAYSAGSYTHDIKENGSITSSQRGAYTIIWEVGTDKNWKVSLVQIEVIAEK